VTQPTSPLLGYNNNVHYRGRTFHIQTEDSGTKYARIITHLFVDGGQIVKSTRAEYGELLALADRSELVRQMMKEQHKAMFLALRAGQFDEAIERVVGPGVLTTETPLPSYVEPVSVHASSRIAPPPLPREMVAARAITDENTANEAPRKDTSEPLGETPTPASVSPSQQRDSRVPKSEAPRSVGKLRPSRASGPAESRRARVVDDPTPIEFLPPTAPSDVGRSTERLQRCAQPIVNPGTKGPIDPRNQSIFGDNTDGRQSLDEVILSFLEDEES
jgi:hypothetical protein